MIKRNFDEMIAYFNRTLADMDISQQDKMILLGIVVAIGAEHDATVPHWIPVTERLPDMDTRVLCTEMSGEFFDVEFGRLVKSGWLMERYGNHNNVIAWMPVPEHYKLRQGGT